MKLYGAAGVQVISDPVFFAENEKHAQAQRNHKADHSIITVFPVQLGHVIKVHSVYSSNNCQRHEHRRNRGKYPHDLIRTVRYTGLISFSQVAHQIAICFESFRYFYGVLIDVTEIFLQLIIDETQIFLFNVLMTSF